MPRWAALTLAGVAGIALAFPVAGMGLGALGVLILVSGIVLVPAGILHRPREHLRHTIEALGQADGDWGVHDVHALDIAAGCAAIGHPMASPTPPPPSGGLPTPPPPISLSLPALVTPSPPSSMPVYPTASP